MAEIDSDNEDGQTQDFEDEEDIEDDEATLDEEDALNDEEEEDYGSELKELQEDGDLPLEDLRRKYCGAGDESAESGGGSIIPSLEGENEAGSKVNEEEEEEEDEDEVDGVGNEAQTSSSSCAATTQRIGDLRGKIFTAIASTCETVTHHYFKPDDLDEDDSEDYIPPEFWKKEIRVGSDFQVLDIPEVLRILSGKSESAESSHSEPLWIPSAECCPENLIIEYLVDCEQIRAGEKSAMNNGHQQQKKKCCKASPSNSSSVEQQSDEIVPDDENALFALFQAGYNLKEAKSECPFEWPGICSANGPRLTQPQGALRAWTEEECANFEAGIAEHGKCFWKIRRDFLPSRMTGEIVCFYYNWKKTERCDLWRAEQQRLFEQQHFDVNCSDLMGQIAESILRQSDEDGVVVGVEAAVSNSKIGGEQTQEMNGGADCCEAAAVATTSVTTCKVTTTKTTISSPAPITE